MSVLEQMAEFERSIVERLRELAPLVREYQELQAVAERLGLDPGPDVPVPGVPGTKDQAPSASDRGLLDFLLGP